MQLVCIAGVRPAHCQTRRRGTCNAIASSASLLIFEPQDVKLGRLLTTLQSATLTGPARLSWDGAAGTLALREEPAAAAAAAAPVDGVTVRLFFGEVVSGPLQGAPILLKAYPPRSYRAADALAANELATHAALQPPCVAAPSANLAQLLGGLVAREGASAGEQWLVFEDCGRISAADYVQQAGAAMAGGGSMAEGRSQHELGSSDPFRQRGAFIREVLRQALQGLAFMHANFRLHQSLSLASILLSTTDEQRPGELQVQLSNLGYAVDVSNEALFGGATLAEVWERAQIEAGDDPTRDLAQALWTRARREGAWSESDRRAFGIADDMGALGWLLLELVFGALCPPGSMDAATLRRLLGSTFMHDMPAFREYCAAEDAWASATALLEAEGGAGWELAARMLARDWRERATAAECLEHRFLEG